MLVPPALYIMTCATKRGQWTLDSEREAYDEKLEFHDNLKACRMYMTDNL